MSEVTHRCPIGDSSIMPCCGLTPIDKLWDRMTLNPHFVTCNREMSRFDKVELIVAKAQEGEPPTPEDIQLMVELFNDISEAIRPVAQAIIEYVTEVSNMLIAWYQSLPGPEAAHRSITRAAGEE